MELRTYATFVKIHGEGDQKREYMFSMPYGCPLGEAYDVVFEVLQQIAKRTKEATESVAPKTEDQ